MYKQKRLRAVMVVLFALMFTMTLFMPTVYAGGGKGGGGTTVNAAPVINGGAEAVQISTDEDKAYLVNLNASDPNKDALAWSISTEPAQGSVVLSTPTVVKGKSQVTITYTPSPGYSGTDSFAAMVDDRKGGTDTIIVNVTIIAAPEPPPAHATIDYVALGDSIATGTLYGSVSIESYVTKFYRYLQAQNPNADVTLQNFAANGNRTNELGAKLGLDFGADLANLYNQSLVEAVKGAEIITISIGGNNLMQAAKDESALGGYNFNNINDAVAQQGVADFNAQWKPIIEKIKSLNANAQVIWYTMYNPYNESDTVKHNQVDSYLFRDDGTGINDIIASNTGLGYSVAQVYQNFNDKYANNMGAVTYFYPTDFWGMLTRNPHPNSAGQDIIELLHEQLYTPIN